MSKRTHTVVSGDTLGRISIRYLGTFGQWTKIRDANPQLAGRKLVYDGSPTIYPGDVLVIPGDEPDPPPAEKTEAVVSIGGDKDAEIFVDGKRFMGFTDYEIDLPYDSLDAFSFGAAGDLAMEALADAMEPFAFKSCKVYYQGRQMFAGTLLTPDPSVDGSAKEVNLQGYPLCGILNDCTVPPTSYPCDYKNMRLEDIARKAAEPYGVGVVFRDDSGAAFEEAGIEPKDKVLDFLIKLAKERGMLVSNDGEGRLVFFKAKKVPPAVTLKQGEWPLMSVKAKFNAQAYYSHITGFTKESKGKDSLSYTYQGKYPAGKGVMRHTTVTIENASGMDELQRGVKAEYGRMMAGSVSYEVECGAHEAGGVLFTKGMTVKVHAPGALIRRETDFICTNLKLKKNTGGKTASLSLALPGSYIEGLEEAMPWE